MYIIGAKIFGERKNKVKYKRANAGSKSNEIAQEV